MESLVKAGKEWLYRTPYSTFWRATTDNDRGNGFPLRSGMWLGADQFRKCIGFQLSVDGEAVENHNAPENNVYSNQEYVQEAVLTYTYETITVPATTVDVSYTVHADGKIHVLVHYHGKEGLPELPVFGMRFRQSDIAMKVCQEKHIRTEWREEFMEDMKWKVFRSRHIWFPRNAGCIWRQNVLRYIERIR